MTSYNNNNSSESKIESKFYPLYMEEYLRAYRELTKAQLNILYYLKSLDPDGDGLAIDSKEIAKQLGLSKVTVSRALKALNQLGWLELEIKTGTTVSVNQSITNN